VSPLYPAIEPFADGRLDVGDGQRVHWEVSGSPAGKPALFLHGGPGSGCIAEQRRFFDPAAYRIVLFDQRGCGRSTPSAGDPATDLAVNTTWHLVSDIERLRVHLHVESWLVMGISWGATLALAYAEAHPERVTELVLAGVTMTRRTELDWFYRVVAPLFPAAWEQFRAGVPAGEREADLIEAYHRLLHDPDPRVRARAADDWSAWELAVMSGDAEPARPEEWRSPVFRYGRARLVTHYFRHAAWLDKDALLRDAGRLAGIRGAMIHGRLDLGAPLATAWELARAWPDGELVVVDGAGHSATGMADEVVAATSRYATPRQ
jgi:proline iminopeptidase